MYFTHTTLLLVGAVVVRLGGAPLRRLDGPLVGAGWLLCMVAVWIAASASGAWTPLWVAAAAAAVAWGLDAGLRRRRDVASPHVGLLLLADVSVFGLLHLLSAPAAEWTGRTALVLALIAAAWIVLEAGVALVPRTLRWGPALLGLAASLWLVGQTSGQRPTLGSWITGVPHLAMTAECEGRQITLSTGSVAWLSGDSDQGQEAGSALVLHGAHPAASLQPSACVLRRALEAAGFRVLALDHPGFGASPSPPVSAPLEAWDPVTSAAEALDRLKRTHDPAKPLLLVGHSMGTGVGARLAASRTDVDGLILMGMALGDDAASDSLADYWYERFHADRGLTDSMPRWKWEALGERFGDAEAMLRDLEAVEHPVAFVTFGHEWPNIVATRDSAYGLIREPKAIWHLEGSTHYLNAFHHGGLVLGDWALTKALAARLRRFAEALEAPDPGP